MEYEYKTVVWHLESGNPLEPILNEMGAQGWVFQTSIARNLVFMRPLIAAGKRELLARIGIDYDDEMQKMAKQKAEAMQTGRAIMTAQQKPQMVNPIEGLVLKKLLQEDEARAAGGITGGQLMEMTQEQRDKLKAEIEATKTPEPFKAGGKLPFNTKYPATGILDSEGRGPNKRVCDVLAGRNIMNVGQLVGMNPDELDGFKNCGLGTRLKILAMREWAMGRLL